MQKRACGTILVGFVTLDEWTERITRGAQERKGPAPKVEDGKHAFSDYLSLYKLPEGWRIVAKTFQAY